MLRLNRQTRVAITILVECAKRPDSIVRTADVAKLAGSTPMGTAAITHRLMRDGLLSTRRGRYGGVMFGRPAKDVTLADVFRAYEVETSINEPRGAEREVDAVDLSFLDAAGSFMRTLARTTIADVCKQRALLSRQGACVTVALDGSTGSDCPPTAPACDDTASRGKRPSHGYALSRPLPTLLRIR